MRLSDTSSGRYGLKRLALLLGAAWLLTGCGDPDRTPLARQVVQSYWSDISHNRPVQAFHLLTSGNRSSRQQSQFSQDILSYLLHERSLKATIGSASVNGDRATVHVTLTAPVERGPLHGYQHLFWENGSWRVTDYPGLLSNTR